MSSSTSTPSPRADDRIQGSVGRTVLTLDAITKRWRGAQLPVLNDVGLTVAPGSLVQITGRNGAGKTTLLRIAAGLIFPDSGRVTIYGHDLRQARRAAHRQIGFLTAASAGLYARLTVGQHLDFAARIALLDPREVRGAVARSADHFELTELIDRRVDRLSMGQRQRARLAMTCLHRPSLLLLDEPANSLDPEGLAILGNAVRSTTEGGGAVLWCAPSGEAPPLPPDVRLKVDGGRLEPV